MLKNVSRYRKDDSIRANIDANQRHMTGFWRKNIPEINLFENVDNANEAYNVSK